MLKSLQQLREESYLKADLKYDSSSVPTSLANVYINEAWSELYDKMVQADDGRMFAVNATIPPKVGTHSFRLPYDFYHLCSLHVKRGSYYVPGIASDPSQYAELADNWYDWAQPRYFIRENPSTGEEFVFVFPEPSASDLAMTYFPEPARLTADGDTLSNKSNRLEYVTIGTAIRMLTRIERDTTQHQLALKSAEERIIGSIANMDFNSPRRIRDISYRYGDKIRHGRWGA